MKSYILIIAIMASLIFWLAPKAAAIFNVAITKVTLQLEAPRIETGFINHR